MVRDFELKSCYSQPVAEGTIPPRSLESHMSVLAHDEWFLELDEKEEIVSSLEQVKKRIVDAQTLLSGSIALCTDNDPLPWWQRLFRGGKDVRSYFRIEWFRDVAALIFHDENWSEYRAIDHEHVVSTSVESRKKISFGEPQPLKEIYCMEKSRAFSAISEFLDTGRLPTWLRYDFVK